MPFLARSMRQCLLALALLVHSAAALPVALSTHRDAVAAKPSYEDAVAAELIAPDEVTVCLAAGEEGLSVRPMDGGDPEGYEADVARLVARDLSTRLGMDLTLKYVYPTLEERLEYLEQRKCDFMAELLTNDVQGQRRQSVAFTGQPYLVIHEQILVKKSSNVTGPGDCQKAAVASGSQTSRNYAENFPQVEQVLTTGYSSAAIVLLLNGTVDCIANDETWSSTSCSRRPTQVALAPTSLQPASARSPQATSLRPSRGAWGSTSRTPCCRPSLAPS